MSVCQLVREGRGWRCTRCQQFAPQLLQRPCVGYAIAEDPPATGLGDQVEAWLKSHGITPERYSEIKQRWGLPPGCNCAGRKEWLNNVGQWLGIGKE